MAYISYQQQQIVESESRFIHINGCAGSHKTDTLIKCAVRSLQTCSDGIQFLTLVSSVTFEIKSRLENALGITINQAGGDDGNKSNHFVGFYNETPVIISNYDSWVHLLLNPPESTKTGTMFKKKVIELLAIVEESSHFEVFAKGNLPVKRLFLDEAQDLSKASMMLLIEIAKKSEVNITIAGDYLQTIFMESTENDFNNHSMNLFKSLSPEYFDLNICMRCPKGHVDFNNLLLESAQKEYIIPKMLCNNDNTVDKPLLFPHLSYSNFCTVNTNSRIIAQKVTMIINELMEFDPSINPADVAIIMNKVNDNPIYVQLKDTLNSLYLKRGFPEDSVIHMDTNSQGEKKKLNWSVTEGKTVMLSIHGDKGKGHKVVFFLGFTEKSIPKENFVNKPSELGPLSLMNVATTRSTKYLFIGFTCNSPSRYLVRCKPELSKYCYKAWIKEDIELIPQPYKSIIRKLEYCNFIEGVELQLRIGFGKKFDLYDRTDVGTKSKLVIRNDISKDIEHPNDIFEFHEEDNITDSFGSYQEMKIKLQDDHYHCVGYMSELLIRRKLNLDELKKILLIPEDKIIYTENEDFLTCMHDVNVYMKYRNQDELQHYFSKNKKYFEQLKPTIDLITDITNAFVKKATVIHHVFSDEKFQEDLKLFLSSKSNEELPSRCIWNVSLMYNQLTQRYYQPRINSFINFFFDDISILHQNIDKFVSFCLKEKNISFEKELYFSTTNFSPKQLKELGKKKKHEVSISGRCDIINEDTNTLIEIKASNSDSCSNSWIIQTIMHALFLIQYGKQIKQMIIVNVLKGELWKWNIPDKFPTLIDVISNIISRHYEWNKIETENLIESIKHTKIL